MDCFECGKEAHHNHHVVPRVRGGTKTVPLCVECHSKVHGKQMAHPELIKAAWSQKRQEVREGKRKSIGKIEPFWIRETDDGLELDPEKTAFLQEMYKMLVDGYSYGMIASKLNERGIFTPRLNRQWTHTSVLQLMKGKASLGEYQPGAMVDGEQVPSGPPILDYYPKAVSEELYHSALSAAAKRLDKGRGRKAKDNRNIFSGLLFNALDNQPMYYFESKSGKWVSRKLASKGMVMSNADSDKSVLYFDPFEKAFLQFFSELNPSDFGQGGNDTELGICQTLVSMLGNASEDEAKELRIKLKQVLINLIHDITVKVQETGRGIRNKAEYTVDVMVNFLDGSSRLFVTDQEGKILESVNIQMPG
jgi:hypothetical protein